MTIPAQKRLGLIFIILTLGFAAMVHGESDLTQQGIAFLQAQRFKEAIRIFSKMIKTDPNNAKAIYYRGMARYYLNDIDAAISDYTRAISKDAKLTEVLTSRGVAYFRKGNYKQAKEDLNNALKKTPNEPNAINQMAWMLAVCPDFRYRDGEKAMVLAEKAVRIKTTPNYLDTLAAAHAENGRYKKAAEIQRKVIAMFTQEERFNRLDDYLKRLKMYQSGKPWRTDTVDIATTETKVAEPDFVKKETQKTEKIRKSEPKTSKKPTKPVATSPVKTTPQVKKPIGDALPTPAVTSKPGKYPYTIFISTYQDPKISKAKVVKLRQNRDPAFLSHAYFKDSGHWYQIYFGWFQSIGEAKKAAENLTQRHFKKAIVVKKPYAVQAGKSQSKPALKKMASRLAALNYPAYQIADPVNPDIIRMLIGAYSTETVPDKLINTLKTAGFNPKIVRR